MIIWSKEQPQCARLLGTLYHHFFKMAPSPVWTLLKPLLLISKWTGTFPIDMGLNQEGQIRVTVNKRAFIVSLVYHFINLSRDFHYMYVLINGFIQAGGSVKPIQILTLLNDTLYNFFMIAIFLLTLTKVRTFSYILSKFEAIQNEFQFNNSKKINRLIAFSIMFQMKDIFESCYRMFRRIVRGDDINALTHFHFCFSMLAITNHSMIELEFGIIVYVVLAHLIEMNSLVAGSIKSVKNTNWDGMRRIFAHLHDICVHLNASYALCILCSLILRAIHVQIEVFRNATLFYDLLVAKQGNADSGFMDAMRWLIMELFRLIMIIIVCAKVTSEVSLKINLFLLSIYDTHSQYLAFLMFNGIKSIIHFIF